MARFQAGFRWHESFGAKPFFEGEVEPCINGGALALGAYFGHPTESLASRLLGEQLEDGGWNCDAPKSTRSSFHTTICVLEGLLEYERAAGSAPAIAAARRRGEEYLLERESLPATLDRRGREPGVPDLRVPAALRVRRPPRARLLQGRRCPSPIHAWAKRSHIVKSRRQADGRWLLDRAHAEALAPLPFGESMGEPSRWNTLRALRVLRWHERDAARA